MYSYDTNSTVAVTLVTYLKYFCNGIVDRFQVTNILTHIILYHTAE